MYDIRGADGTGTSANPVTPETSSTNLKTYTIRKLADGNCWMTENLALPLAVNTQVEASYANGSMFSYTPTNAAINNNAISSERLTGGGYYYTWYAATTENGDESTEPEKDITSSICPKGWRLPANYTISPNKSFGGMTLVYLGYADNRGSYDYGQLEAIPLSYTRAGYYTGGSYYGSYGYYWSSTATSPGYTYVLTYYSSYLYPQYGSREYNGYSIRCVAI